MLLITTLAEWLAGTFHGKAMYASEDEALAAANELPVSEQLIAVTVVGPGPVDQATAGEIMYARRDPSGQITGLHPRPAVAEALDLLPHPEGGWFRETWRTSARTAAHGGERSTATGIYFMLGPGEESVWHRVRSDEMWLWHRGGPLTLRLGGDGPAPGPEETITLGPEVDGGQTPQALVPAGAWQAARPQDGEETLVSCVVSPGFDFADFQTLP